MGDNKNNKCWLADSNRWKHLLLAIPIGVVFSINAVLGAASAMEFKDKQWGGKPDNLDWIATMIGGAIGEAVRVAIAILIFK